jgi:hypothetical protein
MDCNSGLITLMAEPIYNFYLRETRIIDKASIKVLQNRNILCLMSESTKIKRESEYSIFDIVDSYFVSFALINRLSFKIVTIRTTSCWGSCLIIKVLPICFLLISQKLTRKIRFLQNQVALFHILLKL